jgi:hypothetical protein
MVLIMTLGRRDCDVFTTIASKNTLSEGEAAGG